MRPESQESDPNKLISAQIREAGTRRTPFRRVLRYEQGPRAETRLTVYRSMLVANLLCYPHAGGGCGVQIYYRGSENEN